MSLRLMIPFQALNPSDSREFILNQPARCSHCNSEPALFFETHLVTVNADRIEHRQIGKKFRVEKRILVRLPLCEACYKKDYLSSPDAYAHDATPLGKKARQSGKLANVAAFFAALGIILLTPFIPAVGILTTLKAFWYIVLAVGIALLGIAWILQKSSQNQVRHELARDHVESTQYPRAEIWNRSSEAKLDPATIVFEIIMNNENWIKDCARLNNWRLE